tara:strand:- start:4318 stop:5634 length:1317 start_codon:yes stop_codon:yes gene_type:complete
MKQAAPVEAEPLSVQQRPHSLLWFYPCCDPRVDIQMNFNKLKMMVGRKLARNGLMRRLVEQRLLRRTVRPQGSYVAVLSMGRNGHSYSAARAARALGRRVLLITDQPQLQEMAYADALIPLDPLTDLEAILTRLEGFKMEAVVVSIKHLLLPAQAAIADKFGLISAGAETGLLNNDKFAWRKALDAAGVVQPEYSDQPEPFEGRACIRKPRSGTGSANVSLMTAQEEKLTAAERASGVEYFFEEMIEGDQYDFEGVVEDGTPRVLSKVFEKYIPEQGTFAPRYFLFNAPIEAAREAALDRCLIETLAGSAVHNGAFHVEMRVRGDHAVPIDFANRMGYERLMTLASGEDFGQAHVNCFLRAKAEVKRGKKQAVVQFFCWTPDDFDIARARMREHPRHVFDQVMVPHAFASIHCLGMVTFQADTHEELAHITAGLNVRG